jgi:hypothetical protein
MAVYRWLKAAFTQWIADVTGGVLIGMLALYSELSGVTVPPRIYEIVVVLALFQAMFLAWRREETNRIDAETQLAKIQNRRKLNVFLDGYSVAPREKELEVKINFLITNPGEQTSLHTWRTEVSLKSGERYRVPPWSYDREFRRSDDTANLISDQRIIEHGGTREGFIRFAFGEKGELEPSDVRKFYVRCADSFETEYELETPDLGPEKLKI